MKLQLNNSGAWKNVITFAATDEQAVRDLAERLGKIGFKVASSVKWAIVNDHDEVCAVWTGVNGWKPWRSPSSRAEEAGG